MQCYVIVIDINWSLSEMTIHDKGQFLLNCIRSSKGFPKYDPAISVEQNRAKFYNVIENYLYCMPNVKFDEIMKMWENQEEK